MQAMIASYSGDAVAELVRPGQRGGFHEDARPFTPEEDHAILMAVESHCMARADGKIHPQWKRIIALENVAFAGR